MRDNMELRWKDKIDIGEYILYINDIRQFSLYDVNIFRSDWTDTDRNNFGPYEFSSSFTGWTKRIINANTLSEAKVKALAILFEYYREETELAEERLKYCTDITELLKAHCK